MANAIAVRLDRQGAAEMSCIAGVGGDVEPIVRLAGSGRKIIAIDGCPLECSKKSLERHGIEPSIHVILTKLGIKKVPHKDYDELELDQTLRRIASQLL